MLEDTVKSYYFVLQDGYYEYFCSLKIMIMTDIQKTNICCLDLTQDSIDYLKSLDLNVFEGSLGSVFSIKWERNNYGIKTVLVDVDYPLNLQEYHVFIHDMENPRKRERKPEEHQIRDIDSGENRHLECYQPVNIYDLRPYGLYCLKRDFKNFRNHRRIEIIFVGSENRVEYISNSISTHDPRHLGPFSNIDGWNLVRGEEKYGQRIKIEEHHISKALFESRFSKINYKRVFYLPTDFQGEERVIDQHFMSLLSNIDGECISYMYYESDDYIQFILPQVEDKATLLKDLFENVLFKYFSEYFPDVEARSWIYTDAYLLPDEHEIKLKIESKREELEKVIQKLKEEEVTIKEKNKHWKQLLTETGTDLVASAKYFLEWLGFENVIDKDKTLKEGELKEEDLCFEFEGTLVLVEVKGINGTSTDAECSQIDKIVNRRMRQLRTTDVHGVYIVNNQKNVEPLKRNIPPFNDNQIKDAESQSRTMIYSAQLFTLYSDIENGYISKEQARMCLMQAGLADFHHHLISLGVPYHYYKDDTVVCFDLKGTAVSVGDTLLYKDNLGGLVGCKVEGIQQDKTEKEMLSEGKVGIKVNQKVPRNKEFFCTMDS